MLIGINDSKKSYFIWLSVITVLFIGILIFMQWIISQDPDLSQGAVRLLLGFALPYLVATFPIGWTIRRRLMKWYVHIPTEKIKVFETNIIVSLFKLIACMILAGFNILLLAFYIIVSVFFGVFFTPYFVISGIIFITLNKI